VTNNASLILKVQIPDTIIRQAAILDILMVAKAEVGFLAQVHV
jgi:hypothetical protein